MKLRRSIATFVSVATLVLGGFVGEAGAVQSESASGQISVVAHTSATATYTCPTGGVLNGTTCDESTTSAATANTTYSCPGGGTLTGSGSSSECNIAGSTYAATPTTTYSCPSGGSLSGSECYSSTSYDYGATESSSCGTGFAGGPDGCETSIPLAETFCTSPSTYSGGYCTSYYAPTISYSCPDGGSQSGSLCYSTEAYDYGATGATTYSCTGSDTLNGTTCTGASSTAAATPETTYSCSSGATLANETCTTTTTYAATSTLTCPSGQELDGTNCVTPISSPPPGGSGSGSGSTTPPNTVTTFTAIAIATDGLSFTGSSTTSQTDAQAAANSAATAYDATHPVEITVVPKTASLTANVTLVQAPMSDPGTVKATLYGPVPANARSCKSISVKRYSAAKKTSRTVAVSGSGTHVVAMLAPRKVSGCYAWSGTVTYDGGFTANTAISSKSAVYVTARK